MYTCMRQVISTLIKSIPAVSTLGVVMVLFFGIFDIIAMQLFGGRLGSCLDPLGVYTDSEIYVPGFGCIEKEACTFQHITGFSETFPPADLYNRTVLAGAGADLLETLAHDFFLHAPRSRSSSRRCCARRPRRARPSS